MNSPSLSRTSSSMIGNNPSAWRRDMAGVLTITAIVALLAMHFELSERFLHWAAENEGNQADEWPGILLTFAAGLLWFSWRRYHEARRESLQRRRAEAQLALALSENRLLARASVDRQETERRALARELHDELGQTLNAIKIDAVTIRDFGGSSSRDACARASAIIHSTDQVHRVVTEMIRRLRPVGLDDLGLEAALEHCVEGWRQRLPGMRFRLEVPRNLPELGEDINIGAYRIVQESLTNIAKHSGASDVSIALDLALDITTAAHAGSIIIKVQDNGIGASLATPRGGLGLIGMRERAEALGGELSVESQPGHGFTVHASLPFLDDHSPPISSEGTR